LQPIPIPSQPFEVVSVDFIPELPLSDGFDNILVIVDKLTKYRIFIPTTRNIMEVETAALFFKLNLEFLDKLFLIEILGGAENFGKKFVIGLE
jgi:hypothetical protein